MHGPYTAHPIAPHFWRIEERNVRMFLLEGDGEALLIDTGFGSGDLKEFLSTLTPHPVTRVLITHADPDHIGGLSQFEQVWMHPADFPRCAKNGKSVDTIHPLWESTPVRIGQWCFEVILLAGHTPGSIVLLDRVNRLLIGGDMLQDGPIYMFGSGRCLPAYLHSLDRLWALSDEFDLIYPSHHTVPLMPDIIPALKEGGTAGAGRKRPQYPSSRRNDALPPVPLGPRSLFV